MLYPVLWYRNLEGVYPRPPDTPPDPGAALLGWGVLDGAGALTVRELLDAQLGDAPDETALVVAEWRREHPAVD